MGELKKELIKLIKAWWDYIKSNFYQYALLKKIQKYRFTFITFLGAISFYIAFWLVRNVVYAQRIGGGITHSYPWDKFFSLIIGGTLAGISFQCLRKYYVYFKRGFDIFISSLGLIIFSPLFIIVSLLIKIDSDGPVFFRQERVGKDGKIFKIWKFRTMRMNAERETGPVWAQDNDPRITGIGRFLRTTHLDEIPQLINVFKGEMSLIGPRPERPEMISEITKHIPDFPKRLCITPGITGLAQSRYKYGASIRDASHKLKYDLLYMRKMCWLLDFQIILWTIEKVVTGEGAR